MALPATDALLGKIVAALTDEEAEALVILLDSVHDEPYLLVCEALERAGRKEVLLRLFGDQGEVDTDQSTTRTVRKGGSDVPQR